jgi:predicted outer membrane repeat protein
LFESEVTLDQITFKKGEAKQGGAIYSSFYSTLNIISSTFVQNTAVISGGAIYMQFSQTLDIQ